MANKWEVANDGVFKICVSMGLSLGTDPTVKVVQGTSVLFMRSIMVCYFFQLTLMLYHPSIKGHSCTTIVCYNINSAILLFHAKILLCSDSKFNRLINAKQTKELTYET